MAIIIQTCPHCLSKNMTFSHISWRHIDDFTAAALDMCEGCSRPVSFLIHRPAGQGERFQEMTSHKGEIHKHGWGVMHVYPAYPDPQVPELLPPAVARIYLQAERNFTIKGNEEASGTMYRKALDIGLKLKSGVPTDLREFIRKVRAQYSLGKRRAHEALSFNQKNDTGHLRAPGTR